jgi:outer membrane protein W
MNRLRVFPALAALLLLAAWPASAQYQDWTNYRPSSTLFTIGWQMAQPIGSLHEYTPSASFRGFTMDWRSLVMKNVSLGLRFNWNRFNTTFDNLVQTTTTTGGSTGGTLSGPVFRYADQFALEGVAHYYFGMDSGMILPFIGVGLGGVWSSSYQQTADLANAQSGFYFIASPEIGLTITLAKGSTNAGLNLAVMYNFTTASFRNVSNAQSLAETVALSFGY